MNTWDPDYDPGPGKFGPRAWIRIILVWLQTATVVYGLLVLFWLVRAAEWPFGRPITPEITRIACGASLRLMGLRLRTHGTPMKAAGAVVANHVSWLDIFALNVKQRVFFVAKSEIKLWFGIGILAKTTDAVFIERDRRKAREQQDLFASRFRRGDTLLFFPEGTSTDGMQVLPFKSTLFSALFHKELEGALMVQPVTVNYEAPPGEKSNFYGFWGNMSFRDHIFKVISVPRGGAVNLIYHRPVPTSRFRDRKELARHCEETIRAAHIRPDLSREPANPPTC